MQCFQRHVVDLVVGGFLVIIGLILLVDGRIAAKKLAAAHQPSREDLLEKFSANDGDKDGALDYKEFGSLLVELGVNLTAHELELACFAVDQDGDEKISEEELLSWWESFHGMEIRRSASCVVV
jgi:Ca2+-binding EF-hand superfamily protein